MDLMRASEIGEYLYCRRAWWLRRVRGLASANRAEMEAGTAYHAARGQGLRWASWLRRLAWATALTALVWLWLVWLKAH